MLWQELRNFNQNLWTIFLDNYLNGIIFRFDTHPLLNQNQILLFQREINIILKFTELLSTSILYGGLLEQFTLTSISPTNLISSENTKLKMEQMNQWIPENSEN